MNSRRTQSAFTLVEVLLATSIMAMIALGLGSAMVMAARAAPSDRSKSTNAATITGRAVDQLSAELSYATAINSSTATSIDFTVPDRTGDGNEDKIQYSWSGVSGAPLLRSINGRTGTPVATNVTQFQLTYDKKNQQRATTYTESAEVVLNSYDGAGLLNLGDGVIESNTWYGQVFKPSLPADATHWRVTRARLKFKKHSSNEGYVRMQIRALNGTVPGAVIEEGVVQESGMTSSYAWRELSCSNVSGRLPGSSLALVVQWVYDDEACDVQYQLLLAGGANAYLVKTTNSGSTWSTPAAQDMIYYVYGTYSTANPVAYDYWLKSVRCTLRSGSDNASRVHTTIRIANEPQVSGP